MKKNKFLAITLSAVTAFSLFATGCGKANAADTKNAQAAKEATSKGELIEVNIGFPTSGADWSGGTLAVANEYGYLDEYLNPLGYDAKITGFTGAAPAIHEALVSGDLDFAYYAGFAGVTSKSNGIDTKLLAITSYGSGWQIIASTESNIKTIEDLKGKKVGYTRGASPQMYVLKVIDDAELKVDEVELVNSGGAESISGISTGTLDAAVVGYGLADALVKEGKAIVIHEGVKSNPETFYEPFVLTGNSEFVANNEEFNVALIKALLKAKDKIKEDSNAYYNLSSEKSGVPLDQVLGVAIEDLDVAFPLNLDNQYITSLKDIEKFAINNEIITNEIDFDSWVDTKYLDKAVEEYNNSK